MQVSHPQLTSEQRDAIAASGGLPVRIEDPETHKIYVLLEAPREVLLDEEMVRQEVAKGIAALEGGGRVSWDPERIKQEGRRRLAAPNSSE